MNTEPTRDQHQKNIKTINDVLSWDYKKARPNNKRLKYFWKYKVWNRMFPYRSKPYFPRLRTFFLWLALGPSTYDYMLRSVKYDKRTPGAKLVDIVVRKDAHEERIEADWVKTIARIVEHIEHPNKHWYNTAIVDESNESVRLQKSS